MDTPEPKRNKAQLFCGLVFMLGGILWGSDALRAEHRHTAFHIWSRGYLVTDSPRDGLILGGIFIAFGALLVALFLLTNARKS